MDFKRFRALVIIAICITGFSFTLHAQTIYKISNSKNAMVKVSGTSTLHDWVMNAQTFTGEAQFDFKPELSNQLQSLQSLNFSLPVQNLKSGKKKMDKNACKALKAEQYSNIVFKLVSASILPQQNEKYLINAAGNLSMAGVTKAITMDVHCSINSDKSITCTGSKKLSMNDYQVLPPVFMSGAMKTGSEVTVDFILVFTK